MKILVAVDGSTYTKHMLAWLAAHEEMFDRKTTEFTMLTVVAPVPRYPALMDYLDPVPMQEQMSETIFHPLRQFAGQQGWDASFRYVAGEPALRISEAATQGGYDMVVLGSHGHTALANVVLGSVATGVLARGKTPVLIIR